MNLGILKKIGGIINKPEILTVIEDSERRGDAGLSDIGFRRCSRCGHSHIHRPSPLGVLRRTAPDAW
jgi:hypothetical protein